MPSSDTQFKHGQSGNPGGRPKREWTCAGLLESVGEEIEEKSGKKFKELVSKRLWVDAVNGNLGSQKEILNRMDGLPLSRQELTGSNGQPLSITVNADRGFIPAPRKIDASPDGSDAAGQPSIQGPSVASESPENNNGNI